MSLRLFTAISIPEAHRERLAGLQAGVPGARWVQPENFHITLSFIGDVEEPLANDIHDTLATLAAPSFSLTLDGSGSFGSKAPRLLWAGLARSPALEHLQAKVAGSLGRGGFLQETRVYKPHVTLAYMQAGNKPVQPKLRAWLEATGALLTAPFEVDHFTLFESRMGEGGSHFNALHDYPLTD